MRTFRTYATARTYRFSTPKHSPARGNPQVKRLSPAKPSRGVQTQANTGNNLGLGNTGNNNIGLGNNGNGNQGAGNTGNNNIGFGLQGSNLIGLGNAYYDAKTAQFHFAGLNSGTNNIGFGNSGTGNIGFFNSGDGNVGFFNSGANPVPADLGKIQGLGIGNS